MPFTDLGDGQWRLENLIGDEVYDRGGTDLMSRGLYLDVPAWKASVFSLTSTSRGAEASTKSRRSPARRTTSSP
jgi:hypothetical protein